MAITAQYSPVVCEIDVTQAGPQGPAGLVNRGVYNPETLYAADDWVTYDGQAFLAIQSTEGNAPPEPPAESNAFWTLLAGFGAQAAVADAAAADAAASAAAAAVSVQSQASLKSYFGVQENDDSAPNLARLQDAARSGLSVFVDPGTYLIDPTTGLRFDALTTFFRGAAASLVRFKSAAPEQGVHNLFTVSVDGCEISECSFEGEQTAGTALEPNVASHILVSRAGRISRFTAQNIYGIGGRNVIFLSRCDDFYLQNIRGDGNFIHVVAAGGGQRGCMIDGIWAKNTGAEAIALATSNTDGFGVQSDKVMITRVIADGCGINPGDAPGSAAGPSEAIDLFISSLQNLELSNVLIKNCASGGIEMKRQYDPNLPNFHGRSFIHHIQMVDEIGLNGEGTQGTGLLRFNWGGTAIPNPTGTCGEVVLESLVARYGANLPPAGICVNIKDQTDVTIDGLHVTGPIGAAMRFDDADSAGTGALGKRLKLANIFLGNGVQDGIVVQDANIDSLSFGGAVDLSVSRNPVVIVNSHIRDFRMDGGILRNSGTPNQAAFEINNSVVQGVVKGPQSDTDLGLLQVGAYTSGPTAGTAILPNVTNIVGSGGLCSVTFASDHGLASGDVIALSDIIGTTEANGTWRVTVIDADTVDLQESAFVNAYVSGGIARLATDLLFEDVTASSRATGGSAGIFRMNSDCYVRAHRVSGDIATNTRGIASASSGGYKFRGQIFRGFLAAAPVATAGSVGDFFLNHAPAADGVEGWVCTTAGTTGTAVWTPRAALGPETLPPLLTAIEALGIDADQYIYGTGPNAVAAGTITAFARTLFEDASASAARATLQAETLGQLSAINTQTGDDYVLVLADKGQTIERNNAGTNTLTVPPSADVAFPIGSYVNVVQTGAGPTTLVAGAGVTIHTRTSLVLAGQYAMATLYLRDTDEWVLGGDLAPP